MRSVGMRLLALAIAQPLLGGQCALGFITNNPLGIHHRSDGAINRAFTIDMSTPSAERRVMRVAMSDSNSNGVEDRVENGEAVVSSSSSDTIPSVSTPSAPMGPTLQPEEDKLREKTEKKQLEMMKPKENKWASGAFRRGVALQVNDTATGRYIGDLKLDAS